MMAYQLVNSSGETSWITTDLELAREIERLDPELIAQAVELVTEVPEHGSHYYHSARVYMDGHVDESTRHQFYWTDDFTYPLSPGIAHVQPFWQAHAQSRWVRYYRIDVQGTDKEVVDCLFDEKLAEVQAEVSKLAEVQGTA